MKQPVQPIARDVGRAANTMWRKLRHGSNRQRGAVAVMFAGMLILIIAFFGLALDLSRVYNRKVEMQGVADTVAIAAAKKLNGTSTGISDALTAAHEILSDAAYRPRYNYSQTMLWSDAAIKFSRSSNGSTGWLDATEASAAPAEVSYVKVDTKALDPGYAKVNMLFIPVVSAALKSVNVSHAAVAGRARLNITPLAICAMSSAPAAKRANSLGNDELIEYGFRRGVSYDLMNLNPNSTTAGRHFLVDPIAPPGSGSSSSNFAIATVAPYVCTGTVALPKVNGASVSVQSGFPLGALFNHLNSRLDLYSGECDPNAAPPDTNVRQYTASTIGWMSPKPTLQSAKLENTLTTARRTIADLPPPNNQPAPGEYGPLWANARAVPWSSLATVEPATGYAGFAATAAIWKSLYSTGPGVSGYPGGASATPSSSAAFTQLPTLAHRPGIKNRRVLNIPLLACPVSGSVATVLAIGKFFMTVQAGANVLVGEFAGAAGDQQLGGPVELYQ